MADQVTSDSLPAFLRGGVLGRAVVTAEPSRAGHTRAWRGRVRLDDGRSVFVKAGPEPVASALRREALVMGRLQEQGAPSFGPGVLEWRDRDEAAQDAVLVLEDLSSAAWPPPFPPDTGPLFEALDRLAEVDAPPELEPLESWDPDPRARWSIVAEDPAPFLGLGVCSKEWLERSVGALLAAEQLVDLRGRGLVHNDIYSGNLCFLGRRVVFVDWANAARGNHWLDVAFAVVTVLSEGGRLPTGLTIPDEGAWASRLAGHNAVEAAAPLPGWAEPGSTLRQEQLADLRVALGWAARTLDLPPPN